MPQVSEFNVAQRSAAAVDSNRHDKSSGAIYDSIQDIEAQILDVLHTLSTLRQRRNALLPVYCLPVEILCDIFARCVPVQDPHKLKDRVRSRAFSFSHVSQHWRNVALGCPKLWTRPWFHYPSMAAVMMQRATTNPLHIVARTYRLYGVGTGRAHAALLPALSHLERVRTLNLLTDWDSFDDRIRGKLQSPAPLLELLRIEMKQASTAEDMCKMKMSLLGLFGRSTPRLRFLVLQRLAIPWKGPVFSTLSVLKVIHPSSRASESWGVFAECIRAMTCLEVLILTEALPYGRLDEPAGPLAELPSLRRVHVADHPNQIYSLLQLLLLSPELHLSIIVARGEPIDRDDLIDLTACCPVLGTFLQAASGTSELSCMYMNITRADLSIGASLGAGATPKLYLRLESSYVRFMQTFLASAWAAQIETTLVNGHSHPLPGGWPDLLRQIHNVRHLTIVGSTLEGYITALVRDAFAAKRTDDLLHPKLSTLNLKITDKGELWIRHQGEHLIMDAFRIRGNLGAPLKELCAACYSRMASLDMPWEGVEKVAQGHFVVPDSAAKDWEEVEMVTSA